MIIFYLKKRWHLHKFLDAIQVNFPQSRCLFGFHPHFYCFFFLFKQTSKCFISFQTFKWDKYGRRKQKNEKSKYYYKIWFPSLSTYPASFLIPPNPPSQKGTEINHQEKIYFLTQGGGVGEEVLRMLGMTQNPLWHDKKCQWDRSHGRTLTSPPFFFIKIMKN